MNRISQGTLDVELIVKFFNTIFTEMDVSVFYIEDFSYIMRHAQSPFYYLVVLLIYRTSVFLCIKIGLKEVVFFHQPYKL